MTADCAVIGDSIAVGIHRHLPHCYVDARVSRTASQQPSLTVSTRVTVISLGSNSPTREADLHRIRRSLTSTAVIWVYPNRPDHARALVASVADHYGDRTVDARPTASPDGVHPTPAGYRALARQTGIAR